MKVKDIMTTSVATVGPETSFKQIVETMLDRGVGCVVVVDDGRVAGMVTEADLVSKEAYTGCERPGLAHALSLILRGDRKWIDKADGTTAKWLMSSPADTVGPNDSVHGVARHMVERGRKRLPVVDGGRLIGIVSRRDVIRTYHRADDDLKRAVEQRLADPRWVPEGIHPFVQVEDGVVTLEGTARFPIDARDGACAVWELRGVVDVRNALEGREPDPVVRP